MRKIPKPKFQVLEVFMACIETIREPLNQALTNSTENIENAEKDFESKKQTNNLYKISQNEVVNVVVDKKVLINVYKDKLAKTKFPRARVYYDMILNSAPQGLCPLCSQRRVSTLDHYLPKSLYPLLSVTPINLIPSCSDCNTGKKINFPSKSSEETLHPYYDDVEVFSWLKMRIIQVKPLLVVYYTAPPNYVLELLSQRIAFHFDNFKLNSLYTSHAMQEFENIKFQLTNLFIRGGTNQLVEHLQDCYESRLRVNINSWQTAFYECLLKDANFRRGMFI